MDGWMDGWNIVLFILMEGRLGQLLGGVNIERQKDRKN